MQFQFHVPTQVFMGENCIGQNGYIFRQWGGKALVVTGRNSARKSGALADVESVLQEQGMAYEIFDRIEENPTLAVVEAGGEAARRFGPSLIIGIGGGSPLDAAKAIAALAANPVTAKQLYEGNFTAPPLPVIAVPLTAGTGSEVTQYAILTDEEQQTKRSFATPAIFPRAAFLDARYTGSLPWSVTVNSAIDALSHAVEGYLSRKATPISDCLAPTAIRAFRDVRQALLAGAVNQAQREVLLYVSLLGGLVIAHTGTTVVHALGYSLTYFRDVPHGRANGLLLAEYLKFNEAAVPEKIKNILQELGFSTAEECKEELARLLAGSDTYSEEEIAEFARIASQAKNMLNNPQPMEIADLQQVLRASLPVWKEG